MDHPQHKFTKVSLSRAYRQQLNSIGYLELMHGDKSYYRKTRSHIPTPYTTDQAAKVYRNSLQRQSQMVVSYYDSINGMSSHQDQFHSSIRDLLKKHNGKFRSSTRRQVKSDAAESVVKISKLIEDVH
jgi:hypothetical protein